MRTRALWAGSAFTFLLTLAGCGEIDQCKQGEDGCNLGLPLDDGTCRFDLVRDPALNVCVRPSEVTDDEVDGPPLPNLCNCPANKVCQPDGSCLDMCVVPNPITSKSSLPQCRKSTYTFQEAAIAGCTQACARRAALCNEPCDPATVCSAAAAMLWLATVEPTCMNNVECAMKRCETVRDRPCMEQRCGGPMTAPSCADVTCGASCASGGESFINDGVCDDGDLSNAVSAICPWGSDCGDCGPRRGAAPPAVKKVGEQCIDPYQCGAPYEDFSNVPGWCVAVSDSSAIEHCVPDCTMPPHSCPPTFDCQKLRYKENGKEDYIYDDARNVARACFPTMCGG